MRWSRLALLAMAACGAAGCGSAGPTTSARRASDLDLEAPRPAAAENGAGPLLWSVQVPGGPRSYLLGTIHVGVSASELGSTVWQALERSAVVAIETDLSAAAAGMSDDDGPPLSQTLSPGDRERLEELVGVDRARSLASLSASAAYGVLLTELFPTPVPMDLALLRAARDRSLELRYLEDWRTQAELARRFTTDPDVASVLDPRSSTRAELEALVAAYRRGDADALAGLVLDPEEIRADPERHHALFTARNLSWVERLDPWMRARPCFVAVGAGHLFGDSGLLALLSERGFEVRRVGTPD